MSGGAHPEIVTIGDPRRRRRSRDIEDPAKAKGLGQRMVDLLRELRGAGLAAPQIGENVRLIVVEVRRTDLFPDRPESPLYVMVNPVVTPIGESMEENWEGCFSIPGLMGK